MPCLTQRVAIANALGLHLRAADQFVRLAQQFRADVRVHLDGKGANGKSILDLMALAGACGTRLDLEARGPDAAEALTALCELIESRFHEETEGSGD
jgi:phosphocarrier protein HPr